MVSDEKKPFAVVAPTDDDLIRDSRTVVVCGHELRTRSAGALEAVEGRLQRIGDEINAAVTAREARLVAALQRIAAIEPVRTDYPDHPAAWPVRFDCPMCGEIRAQTAEDVANASPKRHDPECPWAIARSALGPNPPEYVPAEQLRAEQARTRGLWAVLNDVAHEGGLASERAREIMAAVGLKTEEDPTQWSDDEVTRRQGVANAEMNRRMAIEHVFREHEYRQRGNQTTITGTAYCGKALGYDGLWNAVTMNTHRSQGPNAKACSACVEALKTETARVA